MDEQHDPEMAVWHAAIAACRTRQNTPAEAFENASLVLAAYRRRRAESRGGAEANDDLDIAESEEGVAPVTAPRESG